MPIMHPPWRFFRLAPAVLLVALGAASPSVAPAIAEASPSSANRAKITAGRALSAAPSGPGSKGTARGAAGRRAPVEDERLACSFRVPLCVEGPPDQAAVAVPLLADLERAWTAITVGLALPEPAVDPSRGYLAVTLGKLTANGSADDTTQMFLRTNGDALASAHLQRDPLDIYDRAFVTLRVDGTVAPGCARDHALAAALARGSLARLAPAIVEPVAHGMTATLADAAVPCAADDDARVLAQMRPQRSLLGSKLFWGDLDATYGVSPGTLLSTSWALVPTITDAGLPPLDPATPDPFAVLQTTFADLLSNGSTFADVLLDMAVRRLYVAGGRDLSVDWHIGWPEVARRLALTPIEPLGSTYLVVDTVGPGAPADIGKASLRVEAEWEQHAELRFALVKLDAAGRTIGRMNAPVLKKSTAAQISMVDLAGAAAVAIVVTNTGDKDVALGAGGGFLATEPHGALFTFAGQ